MFFLLPKYAKYSKPIITSLKYFSTQVIQSITINIVHDNPNDPPLNPKNLQTLQYHLTKQAEGFVDFVVPHIKADIAGSSSTLVLPEIPE